MREPFWLAQWYGSRSRRNPFDVPVRNFAKVDERLYRGAHPHYDAYVAMRARVGIKTVLNLIHGDRTEDRTLAERAGIERWLHVPLSDRRAPSRDDVRAWLACIRDEAHTPVYAHCKGGRHRTGLVIAVYRVVEYGWDKPKAFEEMLAFGWYGALGHSPLKNWFFETFDPSEYR